MDQISRDRKLVDYWFDYIKEHPGQLENEPEKFYRECSTYIHSRLDKEEQEIKQKKPEKEESRTGLFGKFRSLI